MHRALLLLWSVVRRNRYSQVGMHTHTTQIYLTHQIKSYPAAVAIAISGKLPLVINCKHKTCRKLSEQNRFSNYWIAWKDIV